MTVKPLPPSPATVARLDPDTLRLVRALRAERQRQGIPQQELEHRIGLAEGHLAKWETGLRRPSLHFLGLWLAGLGFALELRPRRPGDAPLPWAAPPVDPAGCGPTDEDWWEYERKARLEEPRD